MNPLVTLTETYSNTTTSVYDIKRDIDTGKLVREGATTTASRTVAGTSYGGWIGAIVGAVVGLTETGFKVGEAQKTKEQQETEAKKRLVDHIFNEQTGRKKWVVPVIIGSVLLVGAIVIFYTLR
tara:strand:- start:1959 stop:2330 length:372 start_codon:yes stop_codon:yes gene_type:complete